jgi:hypothetical protein
MSLSADQQGAYEQLLAITASASAAAQERDLAILSETNWDVQVRPLISWTGSSGDDFFVFECGQANRRQELGTAKRWPDDLATHPHPIQPAEGARWSPGSPRASLRPPFWLTISCFFSQAALEVIFSGQAEEPTTNPAASSSASGRPADGPASSSSSSSGLPYSRFSVDDSDQRRPVSERGATPASPGQPGGRRSAGLRIPRGLRGGAHAVSLWPTCCAAVRPPG